MPEGESRRYEGSVQGQPPQGRGSSWPERAETGLAWGPDLAHFGGAGPPWTDLPSACDACEGRRWPAHSELVIYLGAAHNAHSGMVIYLGEALVCRTEECTLLGLAHPGALSDVVLCQAWPALGLPQGAWGRVPGDLTSEASPGRGLCQGLAKG